MNHHHHHHPLPLPHTLHPWRRPKYSARPFALTLVAIALISLLAAAKHARPQHGSAAAPDALRQRDLVALDQQCRLVHGARDQCAFVLANCPDEEAGVISYLTLYYCRIPRAKPVAFVLMTLWLAMLFSTIGIAASDFFCVNLNTIARLLGMSESLAGVTLLAFGNGSPDVFSTFAAFRTHAASLAVGELIGAACFITAVVSGSMALIRPFAVARKSFVRDVSFFLVAAAFSMGFIVDGKLHLWESLTMVAFYVFYVVFVVAWHWWINQRRTRRRKAAAMRSHYVTPGGDEEEIQDYHDEEAPPGPTTPGCTISNDDFANLESAGGHDALDEDDHEEERERWMGEMTNNMRVSRPHIGSRRNTHTPIRPSLVGALEFRAVLSSLQKSRNIQSMPISLRRYSDDPTYTTAQQQDYMASESDPAARPPFDVASIASDASPHITRPNMDIQQGMGNRARAVSTNDIDNARLHPSTLHIAVPDITFGPATPDDRGGFAAGAQAPPSPSFSLSPPLSPHSSRALGPALEGRPPSSNRLAPPVANGPVLSPVRSKTTSPSPGSSPVLEAGEHAGPPNLKLSVPGLTSPPVSFPAYTDYPWSAQSSTRPPSLRMREPSASPEPMFSRDPFAVHEPGKIPRWWPSRILPPPHILFGTLFPTLTNWREKNIWEKILGLVAGLPVFLLTITLPVVEPQKDEHEGGHAELSLDFGLPPPLTPLDRSIDSYGRSIILPTESLASPGTSMNLKGHHRQANGGSFSTTASNTPQVFITDSDNVARSPDQLPMIPTATEPKQWNRWLVILQVFTSPLFVVLILWANLQPDNPRALLRHTLYSLTASLIILATILLTTSPNRPPPWRSALCFAGFAVAIAWISTIANEVVGVLRTLGVILNMSDAILGLTIFAVGNSLGDLVADITVARLGFPIMALSACFGGPMLNILLGIGLSGLYMTITKGEHRHEKHPDRPVHFAPYHIAVSTTLIISGATLLFTLAGLLVAVPMRRWKMDKTIGWGLVVLWVVSTLANVLVEVLGYSSDVS
ncbi:sodium/calcium exchanger protein-like protein [Ampelomyces quisqualis]|uniref:Sodium/calcium exchanger protein-like protein n=1 Tax=Ampelomyces quisqualis TaxID=50730 RepID=A0A6A5QGY5_AMPQU|nr:sodium/calcium exchanger protein-like protein [Ampelomyces quisqualis]